MTQTKPKAQRAWAIMARNARSVVEGTVWRYKSSAWDAMRKIYNDRLCIAELEERGYRAVRVTITVEE